MTAIKGRNTNQSDESTISNPIELNPNTSVKVADVNKGRIYLRIDGNGSNLEFWVKLQPTNEDNDMKGIWIPKSNTGANHWEMPNDNIYTGEVCAISNAGNPLIYVTEY